MLTSSDFNAFYRTDATVPLEVAKWTSGGKDIGFKTLDEYAAATNLEANSLNLSGATNPFFVDEAQGDFRLKAGSPALGRGEKLPADIAQAASVDANAPVHLGALRSS